MKELTQRQADILQFIQDAQEDSGSTPSLREIAGHFGFRSMNAARDHVRALCRKGVLKQAPGRARSLVVATPLRKLKNRIAHIPIYGAIPAGYGDTRRQEPKGCLSVDVETLGIQPNPRTFALQVQGDSMVGRHILDGDFVVCMHGVNPRTGNVVAALIDNESTLKTFVSDRGKPYLRSENPRYPNLTPTDELVIQGVVVAVIRKFTPQ